ncbi:signal peptidase I [Alteriqipengyuania lutimaris]|uniref:Signal peptidase I n=1 Tax=Alteriqipengyuania lutimaris TaxID=1538146 RepID=A0A395LLV6_9SPHN|nr:signal peptidase I [Alteriqipengyuania lutimaris]MBB3033206.1 signal peptidase I [Alteriqipengyuania lutimaris]RDS77745.1 signal peptidase I [Alteriqipengyuania lutimaris]
MSNVSGMSDTDTAKTDGEKDSINWFAEVRGLALMILAVLAFHSFVAKPFFIPSTSMMPNLLVGDHLIVTRYPYGYNWSSITFHLLPRGDWRLFGGTPEYGDIVIPVHPQRNEDYIKRVVGLPGDRIAVRDGQIILNGQPVRQEVEPDMLLPLDLNTPCLEPEFQVVEGPDGTQKCKVPVMRETMPNGVSYLIIEALPDQPLDNYDEILVPDDAVFVMGDNRDYSADSRASVARQGLGGPVPLTNIGGRAEFITFSLDGSATWNPFSWFGAMRGDRAFSTLRPTHSEDAAVQASPTASDAT